MNYIDSKIIEGIKNDDEQSLLELYIKTINYVWYKIQQIVIDKNAIDELTNDTYMKFYKSIDNFDANNKILPYLLTIAKNTAINYNKQINAKKNIIAKKVDESEIGSYDSTCQNVYDILESYLDGDEYLIAKYKIIEGLTFREISELEGCSVSTAQKKYTNAINKIKERMNRY